MKNHIFLILLFVFCIKGQNNQELFLQANQTYNKGNFDQALSLYEKISHKGSAVWQNMGVCCYKMENIVDAVVFWRRALKQANRSSRIFIDQMIEHVVQKEGLESEALSWHEQLLKTTADFFPLLFLQLLFLSLWFLFGYFGINYKFMNLCIIFILLALVGNCLKSKMQLNTIGVIKEEAPLFVGPNDQFASLTILKKAQQVSIKKKADNWFKVQCREKTGWVSGEKIIEV